MAKEHVHSNMVPIRLKNEDYKLFQQAAKANKQTLSEWIRAVLRNSIQK